MGCSLPLSLCIVLGWGAGWCSWQILLWLSLVALGTATRQNTRSSPSDHGNGRRTVNGIWTQYSDFVLYCQATCTNLHTKH